VKIPFLKMHGLGNDYVFLDAQAEPDLESLDFGAVARTVGRRHEHIGADGLILLSRPTASGLDAGAHVRMRIWNADGSEAEMCGNGIRCLARICVERGDAPGDEIAVEVARGLLRATIARDDSGEIVGAAVDMGPPETDARRLPVDTVRLGEPIERMESGPGVYLIGNRPIVLVGIGNPHAVCFVDSDLDRIDLASEGAQIEHDPAFPERINAHFARADSRDHITLRAWERGAGATRACGTGACATLVAGRLLGRVGSHATVALPGGDLEIHWHEESGHVYMAGPCEHVCTGEFEFENPH
jgi:diaminopimelate epimerase